MAKRTYPTVDHATESWDAELAAWRDNLQLFPLPIFEPSGGAFASLPAATQNDRGLAAVNDATAGWILVLSNGAAWRKIPVQAAAQSDSVAADVATLKTDFNALLAKLRASGALG